MSDMRVVSVSALNMYVKAKLEEDFLLRNFYVKGEISNFKGAYSSGHLYFSLKDENACVQAVMFSTNARTLKFAPANGMKVLVRCRASIYEKTGVYQLYCDEMQPYGLGELFLAYEQLKAKLEAEGLFALEVKKPIPKFPLKIGVVTSGSGAARRDIENIISRRFPAAQIIIAPVLVQGEEAPGQIAEAIELFNKKRAADVLIVGRGGGSIEDLWAFNSERVARAVYNSVIPVISAVGHETDFTIIDFAADMRAPTPSAAAELCVPDRAELCERLQVLLIRQKRAVTQLLHKKEEYIFNIEKQPCLCTKDYYISDRYARLSMAEKALDDGMNKILSDIKSAFAVEQARLDAYNPLKILQNGYSVITTKNGKIARSVAELAAGDNITVKMADGTALCTVNKTENV